MDKEFLATEKDIDELKINKADKADLSILENSIDNLKIDKLDKLDIDNALSSTSKNPVQNKVVYEAIQNAGSKITVDNALSPTSENPVQNKVVTQAINTSNQNINILKSRVQAVEDGLNPDISADFLTSDGFGNLRYYNGHFQKYDANSDTWVDTTATPDNVYIFNMVPQAIKKISGTYDTDLYKYKLKFEAPDDTIIDGQLVCIIDKVIIRRKLGSAPENENDGDFVAELKRRELGLYKNNWFIDNTFTPSLGDVYYYKVFPVSTLGHINYSTVNETRGLVCKDYFLYGFKIDQNESDPASMITYLNDCDNAQYTSAFMDDTTGTFNYGDWDGAWFIEKLKPCMLKYDGTVDYELEPNNYTKKIDGTASDVANIEYEGNAMVGIPKVYWKITDNGDNTANVYFSNKKINDDFVCWSHIDNNGNEIDYCYMPIYIGGLVNNKLRSLSGLEFSSSKTRQQEIDYAEANNVGVDKIWHTEVFSDKMLISLLILLIGKNTNSQKIFGYGGGHSIAGTMDNKGLFYGNNAGVKIFGMEDWWNCRWRSIAGWIYDNGVQKIKLTYGQSDGSTVDGYNTTGDGYISVKDSNIYGGFGGGISKMLITDIGLIPIALQGSTTTYYSDGVYYSNSALSYCETGGYSDDGAKSGIFANAFHQPATATFSYLTASISCKPLAPTT